MTFLRKDNRRHSVEKKKKILQNTPICSKKPQKIPLLSPSMVFMFLLKYIALLGSLLTLGCPHPQKGQYSLSLKNTPAPPVQAIHGLL